MTELMIKNKQLLLILLWTAIALMLRFANLDLKPLWTDEFSTLVFSLGNSFRGVPIDRAIDLPTLLQPLQFRPDAGIGDVLNHLLLESNHPPVYFMLAHWWM
ncbi:MAG: glycosyltransferase, partial [Microcoleus sp.]